MGIREFMNKSPAVGAGAAAGLVVVAVAAIVFQARAGRPTMPAAYYSADDGATYFTDDPGKVTPFDYKGGQAVVAHVFVGKDGRRFVGYLERHNPEVKDLLVRFRNRKPTDPPPSAKEIAAISAGREFKLPKAKDWVSARNQGEVMKIQSVKGPDGSPATEID